jgi:hypothetical protein
MREIFGLLFFLVNVYLVCHFPGGEVQKNREKIRLSSYLIVLTHTPGARARILFKKKKSNDFIDRVAIQSRRRGIGSKTREKDELGESVHDEWWCF